MKKLLAIVLCIAMIASLSVTAFADQAAASTVSGVSLYPAVKQANHFYGSLMKYDIMNTVAGLFKGFSTAYPTLVKNSTDAKNALNQLVTIFNAVKETGFDDEDTGKLKEIVYPEGTSSLGYALAKVWWGLGNAFVGSYIPEVGKTTVADAAGTITGAIAAQELKIPTVTAPTAITG